MNNFDLKNFLTENKLTSNSKTLSEQAGDLEGRIRQEMKETQSRIDREQNMDESFYNLLTGRIQAYEWVLDQMKQV